MWDGLGVCVGEGITGGARPDLDQPPPSSKRWNGLSVGGGDRGGGGACMGV